MKILSRGKDGGPDSKVEGFWLVEIKSLFSIALLRFGRGSREVYHSHAFNSVSWVMSGGLKEKVRGGPVNYYFPSLNFITTKRNRIHKVYGINDSNWVLTFRGPWSKTWVELSDSGFTVLESNRVPVHEHVYGSGM